MTTQEHHEAEFWQAAGDAVRCGLCRHECEIKPERVGLCRVRKNLGGRLVTLTYSRLIAAAVDPIEKKPLYHVLPGTKSMSVASVGCNFRCKFCQNWNISQGDPDQDIVQQRSRIVRPSQVVQSALSAGCRSVSYTYTEPTVFFEYARHCAEAANRQGLVNCFVTNGFMSTAAIERIAPVLDAANVDLKAFRDETYRKVIGARLDGVLDCLRDMKREGIWLEVTTLIVPGMNDSESELSDIAGFIAEELSEDTPWHISRYHDDYHFAGRGMTTAESLAAAAEIGRAAGLSYVYQGNIGGEGVGDTICPGCGKTIIARGYMGLKSMAMEEGRCAHCGHEIPGVWR